MPGQSGDGATRLIGRTFHDRYRVERLLGRGGMGAVYLARQLNMDRLVALKVLAHHLSEDPRQVQRFNQEAMACSRLRHPNTIRVFDHGQSADGYLYLAMEYLEGQELSRVIRREAPLEPRRVIHILRQVVKSIGEAHERGLIHRDLKPDNVFLSNVFGEDDFVKVLDFGIAKFTEATSDQASLTNTGSICGTPLYIAPEQALGKEVTARTDLYSLGILAYEMLTGAPPFKAETPIAIVMKQIHEAPPPMSVSVPGLSVPPGLETLVFRLLAKDPRSRPASASEVSLALEAALASPGMSGPSAAVQTGRFKAFTEAGEEEATHLAAPALSLPDFGAGEGGERTQVLGAGVRPPPVPDDVDDTESQIPRVPPPMPAEPSFRVPPAGAADAPKRTIAMPVSSEIRVPTPAPALMEPPGRPRVPTSQRPVARPAVNTQTGAIPVGPVGQGGADGPPVLPFVFAAVAVLLLGAGAGWYFVLGPGAGAGDDTVAVAQGAVEDAPIEEDDEPTPASSAIEAAAEEEARRAVEPDPVEPVADPEPEAVTVTIRSTPPGASVSEEGDLLGTTPLELECVADKARTLTLTLEGHDPSELVVTPRVDDDASLSAAVVLSAVVVPEPVEPKPRPAKKKKKTKKKKPKWEDF